MKSREEIIKHFFDEVVKNSYPRWCTAERCACMGCVNGGWFSRYSKAWKEVNGDIPYITEEDVKIYLKGQPPREQGFEFRSFPFKPFKL
jgi:hypothetical protein